MWIRTKKGTGLVKILNDSKADEQFYIQELNANGIKKYELIYAYSFDSEFHLGMYSSDAKAMYALRKIMIAIAHANNIVDLYE